MVVKNNYLILKAYNFKLFHKTEEDVGHSKDNFDCFSNIIGRAFDNLPTLTSFIKSIGGVIIGLVATPEPRWPTKYVPDGIVISHKES